MLSRLDRFIRKRRPFRGIRLRRSVSVAELGTDRKRKEERHSYAQGESVGNLSGSDWGDIFRTSGEPHWLSLEGLNLEVTEGLDEEMTSDPHSSRQQLLEEVLQTKELLQNKQKNKDNGGWTLTTAEVLNNADREEAQVQMEAYRQQLQLRQRKMSAALKTRLAPLPLSKSLSEAGCDLAAGDRQELQQRLQTLETSIQQAETAARETVSQIRSRRQRQLRTIQDLGIPAVTVAGSPPSTALQTPCTPPYDSGEVCEEAGGTLKRPRSLHSPSLVRRRTPFKFISGALSRTKRRSGADWEPREEPDRLPETPQLRSQISADALSEIRKFERLMETFLRARQAGAPRPRPLSRIVVQQYL